MLFYYDEAKTSLKRQKTDERESNSWEISQTTIQSGGSCYWEGCHNKLRGKTMVESPTAKNVRKDDAIYDEKLSLSLFCIVAGVLQHSVKLFR